jgi:hypothetical protein
MSANQISTYKCSLLKVCLRKKKPGPRPKTAAAAARTMTQGSIDLRDIPTVKELADRIGVAEVGQLAEVLS